jgi:hypothetical protein
MEISFNTKAESNLKQELEFLKLSKIERIYNFINLVVKVNKFPTKNKRETKSFVIEIKTA